MTEREKMISGELYDPGDSGLENDRNVCKELCYKFNGLPFSRRGEGKEFIKKLFGKIKGDFCITAPFWCDYGYNIEIGEDFYVNHNCVILDCAPVKFGDNVLIGPNCGFYTAAHPIKPEERRTGMEFAKPIIVGDDVWFGGGVQVMPGVTIGRGSVIGAGSVVTKDIPEGVIAAGNPCRVIRKI